MENNKFSTLKINVQELIDLIANKQFNEAKEHLLIVSEELDELLDFSEEEEDLIEISRFQVLLNQLHQKINAPVKE